MHRTYIGIIFRLKMNGKGIMGSWEYFREVFILGVLRFICEYDTDLCISLQIPRIEEKNLQRGGFLTKDTRIRIIMNII